MQFDLLSASRDDRMPKRFYPDGIEENVGLRGFLLKCGSERVAFD